MLDNSKCGYVKSNAHDTNNPSNRCKALWKISYYVSGEKYQLLVLIQKSKSNNFGDYYERQYTTILLDKYIIFSYLCLSVLVTTPQKEENLF